MNPLLQIMCRIRSVPHARHGVPGEPASLSRLLRGGGLSGMGVVWRGGLALWLLGSPVAYSQEDDADSPAADAPAERPARERELHPRFPRINPQHIPLLEEIDQQNQRLVPAWTQLRELQEEWSHLFQVFGRVERRNAERSIASVERSKERARRTFLSEYERIRNPLIAQEDALRARALRLTEQPPALNEERQRAREEEIATLYTDALAIHERVTALAQLNNAVTIAHPPTRLEQLGMTRGSAILRAMTREDTDTLLPAHLDVRDALADIEVLEKRKEESPETWRHADAQQLVAAERHLERAVQSLLRTLNAVRRPHEAERDQAQRRLDGVNRRIETAQRGNRSTERMDADAAALTRQIELAEQKLEAIEAFAEWPKIQQTLEQRNP